MLKFSKWKCFTILVIILLSIYFSIANFTYDAKKIAFFPEQKINFGLDLKGGISLTIEADVEEYVKERFDVIAENLKSSLTKSDIKFSDWHQKPGSLTFSLKNPDDIKNIKGFIANSEINVKQLNDNVSVSFFKDYAETLKAEVIKQSMEIVSRRVDSVGTKEVEIQTLGDDMILLQVPGLNDPEEIKKVIGKTARLTFHMVKGDLSDSLSDAEKISLIINSKVLPIEGTSTTLMLENAPVMIGDMLSSVSVNYGQMGEPSIKFRLDSLGRDIFADITTKNQGKMLAIVLDNKIISAPVIREPIISGDGIISGNFTSESAADLVLLLRAGALPVPLKIIEERVVGPTLGLESIKAGIKACVVAAIFVLIIMTIYYRFFGLIANIALIINFIMIISVLTIFGATLTLPGIAGIVLTFGMAVDANVLIFERIKEELKKGRTPLKSIHNGYKFAFTTILDSNITTIAAGAVLYIFGSGAIKGFAVTLIVGILCSIFTSVTITKMLITIWYSIKKPHAINI
jgi:protein-export membrane protein SecD